MHLPVRLLSSLAFAAALFVDLGSVRAQSWVLWADGTNGLTSGTYPVIAVAPAPSTDIYYSFATPTTSSTGRVWRARRDDPARHFTLMPGFPLPTPAAGASYSNVFTITTTRAGEPVLGLSNGSRSDNTDPMIMTWDRATGAWLVPPIAPSGNTCAHNLYRVDRAPNGDLWALCQWHGAYRSTDDGRSFRYLDLTAAMLVSDPAYITSRTSAGGLSAMYSLAFDADGTIYIGTETGGVVFSEDDGATFHPLDADWMNPLSTTARATEVGNVYGMGVALDGRVVFHAFPRMGATPPPDATRLYTLDRVAHTVTIARGIPDYFLGGRMQIVTMPSGAMFFHSNHDTVDTMTGTPTPGGIFMSTNGVDWATMNDGLGESFFVASLSRWIDANGRGAGGGFAVDGNDLYTATSNGKIYRLTTVPTAGPDAGAIDGGAGDGGAMDAGVADAGVAMDASLVMDASTDFDGGDLADASDAFAAHDVPASDGSSAPDAGIAPSTGCGCRATRRSASWPVALTALLFFVRRRTR